MRGHHQAEASGSTVNILYGRNGSDSELPLTAHQQMLGQHKVMADVYDSDPSVNQIYAPKPMMNNDAFLPLANPRDIEESGSHNRNDSTYSVGWAPDGSQRSYSASPNPQPPHSHRPYHTDVEQTPTQATFVNSSSHTYRPSDDYDQAYGGYKPVTPPAAGRGAHYPQPSDATFVSTSSTHNELPNPYTSPIASEVSRPPSYATHITNPLR